MSTYQNLYNDSIYKKVVAIIYNDCICTYPFINGTLIMDFPFYLNIIIFISL